MIDLQDSTISSHWKNKESDILLMLENMESREEWVLDDLLEIKTAIINLAATFDDEKVANFSESPEDILRILSFIKSKRFLCLLRGLEDKRPGITAGLLDLCTSNLEKGADGSDLRAEKIFRDRLVTIFRHDLLERLFSEDRSVKIKEAIKTTTERYGGLHG